MWSNFIQVLVLLLAFWIVYLFNAQVTQSRATMLTAIAIILSGSVILLAAMSALLRQVAQLEGREPLLILVAYLATSIVTFFMYAYDRRAAKEKGWRISERTLHLLELMGGWPGALWGQRHLRHKVDWKGEFRFKIVTLMIAIVHIAFWVLWSAGIVDF
jgi:uncharacterized membrane protein YsdA (DUF1294 family)